MSTKTRSRTARHSSLLLGLDLGTGSARAVLIGSTGKVVSQAIREYPLSVPKPGWSEQSADDWREGALGAISDAVRKAGKRPIAGIGLTGQMHGSVFLDARDRVIRPPLLWNDQRTARQAEMIEQRVGLSRLIRLTGNRALTGFTSPKIIWLREAEPARFKRLRSILLPKDYIRFVLTGVKALDASDASGTGLFDVKRRCISEEVLSALDLNPDLFGPVFEGTDVVGGVSESVARLTGLKAGTPVVGGGGDQAAGAVGVGVVDQGDLMVSLGTSGVVFAASRAYRYDRRARLHAFCHAGPGLWHLMGVMLNAGGALQWLRNALSGAKQEKYESFTADAEEVTAGSEGLFFHPYLIGERTPLNDPYAKGSFFGLTLRHGRGHMVRSCLEGVAFGLREALDLARALGIEAGAARITGGGAKSDLWTSIVADVLGLEVIRLKADEGPAFGAALLAGVGAGVYTDLNDACSCAVKAGSKIQPNAGRVALYDELYKQWRAVRARLAPLWKPE